MRRIILIGGPTASGKSVLALRIAKQLEGIVINADSMQLYKGLPILTACPSLKDYAQVPHFLYETISPCIPYSAALWAENVNTIIQQHPDRSIIIVGGTGFYLKTLAEGIAEIPSIPLEVHLNVVQEWQQKGSDAFYKQLQKADPETSKRLNSMDQQRICRAWEVLQHTGRTLGYWHRQQKRIFLSEPFEIIVIDPEKSWIYPVINQRVLTMIEQGVLQEIQLFLKDNFSVSSALAQALGLNEFSNFLQHKIPLDQAVKDTQQRSRQYAKRQGTWFRHQFVQATFIHPSQIQHWRTESL